MSYSEESLEEYPEEQEYQVESLHGSGSNEYQTGRQTAPRKPRRRVAVFVDCTTTIRKAMWMDTVARPTVVLLTMLGEALTNTVVTPTITLVVTTSPRMVGRGEGTPERGRMNLLIKEPFIILQ
eukprot:TRINITY_DN296_c1_g1_i2.p1 TRINITY_DN296_c1_g1~~TRINITY_DN296_c1_g1_i2.p1  ORF type:complete len:124 (-),score=14.37 TRINITY_DN296_c1_g1_i2:712-1083(-)